MPDRRLPSLGERVKELRHEQGLDQRALANIVKRYVSWISQVERGELTVSDVGMLQRLAVALSVPSRELVELVLGEGAGDLERQRPYVEVLRLALAGHPAPQAALGMPQPVAPAATIDRMGSQISTCWDLVHASRFDGLGPTLASLIPDLEGASRRVEGDDRLAVFALLADSYQIAAAMLVKVGDIGAAWIAADRAIGAGERCGDQSLIMAGQLRMGHTFVNSSEDELALHVLRQAVGLAKALPGDAGPGLVSLTGSCALLLAVLEARRGYGEEAHRHLRVASGLARRLGVGRNDYGTEFGPTNVALHQVAVEVELGNAAEALRLAGKVRASGLSAERQARFLVDVARAHTQRRQVPQAIAALTEAEAIAPAEVADSRLVREILDDLEHLVHGRSVPGLRPLRRKTTHK
ncbi:MAG: helix-turn-helix domain-containing protein [Actinomycetota bacterium]|nr:helix-turn-helix domain-containing protein [Actinomycetota bacterium]